MGHTMGCGWDCRRLLCSTRPACDHGLVDRGAGRVVWPVVLTCPEAKCGLTELGIRAERWMWHGWVALESSGFFYVGKIQWHNTWAESIFP